MLKNNEPQDAIFATVLADGKIHVNVSEDTEGAQKREYETSDGSTGTKYELIYTELSGMLTKISFFEGNYGKSLQLEITDESEEKPVVLSLSTASNYGEDVMKKLINIDLAKPVKFAPFSFSDDKGKSRKGVTVFQDGDKKIGNYFYDAETKENINGYPTPKVGKKPLTKDQWKLYFMEARMFLIDKITEHFHLDDENQQLDQDLKDF